MPLEMWAVTGHGWSYGLSHALSCVLLLASLSSNQVNRLGYNCGLRFMCVFLLAGRGFVFFLRVLGGEQSLLREGAAYLFLTGLSFSALKY